MSDDLDETLLYFTRRKNKDGGLSDDDCIAVNLFWRRDKSLARVLAKVFNVSPNTIYYSCLTGDAESYPNSRLTNRARKTNEFIDAIGERVAWRRYVSKELIRAVNAELERKKQA